MQTINAGDIVQYNGKGWLIVLAIFGDRALCSFQVSEKPFFGNKKPDYLSRYEDLFPVKGLSIVKKYDGK